jgi:hypothetical protein
MQQTMGNLLPPGLEEMRRQNIAMMERAMSLFSPFYRAPGAEPPQPAHDSRPDDQAEPQTQILALQQEVESLRSLLATHQAGLPQGGAHQAGVASPAAKPRRRADQTDI